MTVRDSGSSDFHRALSQMTHELYAMRFEADGRYMVVLQKHLSALLETHSKADERYRVERDLRVHRVHLLYSELQLVYNPDIDEVDNLISTCRSTVSELRHANAFTQALREAMLNEYTARVETLLTHLVEQPQLFQITEGAPLTLPQIRIAED